MKKKYAKNPKLAAWGRLGRAANTEAQKEAARINGAKGGRPPGHRCPCGATGRDITLFKYKNEFDPFTGLVVEPPTRYYDCKKCGRTGRLRDIEVERPRRRDV